ncbi:hypothetical protein G6F62_012290 [Rhizopus arrhizus]|nr:hypothetical protein G6F62_012290 [Rhizopus arrhizus]
MNNFNSLPKEVGNSRMEKSSTKSLKKLDDWQYLVTESPKLRRMKPEKRRQKLSGYLIVLNTWRVQQKAIRNMLSQQNSFKSITMLIPNKSSLQKQQGNRTIKQTTSTDEEEETAMDVEEGLFSLTGVEDVGSQVVRSSTTSLHPKTATTDPTATTNKEDQKHCCLDSTPSSSTLNHIDSTSNNLNNDQLLFYPEGWDITRRTTQAFFEKLETSNNSSVALISSRERLQTSIFENPNLLEE